MNEQECQAKGGKLVDGKCEMPNFVPSTSGFKAKKKSNSPFRMWGSWVGVIIGFLLNLVGGVWVGILFLSQIGLCKGEFCSSTHPLILIPGLYLPLIIFGFLIGWLTHYLVRMYKR